MTTPTPTSQHKVFRSMTGAGAPTASFGPNGPRVPPIETLAAGGGTDYSRELAYICSVVSTWAYSDAEVLSEKVRYYGLEAAYVRQVSVVNDGLLVASTAYLVLSHTGQVGILAFRGTDPANIINLLSDADVVPRPFFDGNVHSGFYANLEAVWDDVLGTLELARAGQYVDMRNEKKKLQKPLETLYVTGHSLGGAMGVLAAARLLQPDLRAWAKPMLRGIYTYGQPMVGDQVFARFIEKQAPFLYRHVHCDDLVPHLPPSSEFKYVHAGVERRVAPKVRSWQTVTEKSGRANILMAAGSVIARAVERRVSPKIRTGHYSVDDHMPNNYVDVSRDSLGVVYKNSIVDKRV